MIEVRGGWQRDTAVVSRHLMTSTTDPKHWRDRADELRFIADMLDEPAKTKLLRVADEYEDLALWAEGKRKPDESRYD